MYMQPRGTYTQVPQSPAMYQRCTYSLRTPAPKFHDHQRCTCSLGVHAHRSHNHQRCTDSLDRVSAHKFQSHHAAMFQRCADSLGSPVHKFHNHQRCTDSLGSLAHKFHNHQRCTAYGSPAMYILPRDTSTQVPRSPAMYSVWGTCTQATHSPVLYCVTQSPVCTSQVSSRSLRHLHGNHTITTECCAGGHKTVTGLH